MKNIRDIKSIDFTFENCEGFSIEAKHFGYVCIDDIKTRIERIACNAISEMHIACKVYIEIFKEADCDYSCWGMNMMKKFDRFLQFNDITSLTLEYDDGSTEEIWVDYRGEHNEINDIQTTKKSSLGNLYIVISAENNVEDVFPDEYIEDKYCIEMQKEFNS